MIFDNVESSALLRVYWPLGQGHSLVTTRDHALAFEPADSGLEVPTFSNQEGAGFFIHLLSRDIDSSAYNNDWTSATQLSSRLGGHPLAISQMAGLMHRRSWSIPECLEVYEKNMENVTAYRQPPGNLASLWRLPFESLNESASDLLATLCLLDPDAVPEELFVLNDKTNIPESLRFVQDEFR